ncbi:MAG TPA: flagellar motor protein MotB [Candidatus Hydrogenedentes bacterium]|nr:flagellar motor protein MotB [Candidatus Hydrogenedentota bacterium]
MAGRKKKAEGGGGAPEWLVTYGDLMSLLLTFFVLLLSFSTISEEDFNQAMMSMQGAFSVLPRFSGIISNIPRNRQQQEESVHNVARRLRRRIQVLGLEREVKIDYDARGGLKISFPDNILFEPGSAELKPEAFSFLDEVAGMLNEMPDSFVEVRGHTDNTPPPEGGPYRDNFDLSHARADAVGRRMIESGGISPERLELVACGSGQPVAPNATEEGRKANRRVDIYVRGRVDKTKIETEDVQRRGLQETGTTEAPLLPISPRELEELR